MGVADALTAWLIIAGLLYFAITMSAGLVQARALRHSTTAPTSLGSSIVCTYVLVPCLDEELVIPATITALLSQDVTTRVLVIDDGSTDRTAERAEAAGGSRVKVLRRVPPDARLGKGAALNAGLAVIRRDVARRGIDPARVIVCVMDADGELTRGAITAARASFADPTIGGAQLPVRIRNRDHWLGRMQDFEFWLISAVTQIGRMRTGTVSLGGNGQFTRLSALSGLGGEPWSSCLTEDLDLSIRLVMAGWRVTCVPEHHVSQQGVTTLRALVRQRSRWFQGHISCNRHIPALWRTKSLSNAAVVEATSYLLVPTLLILPWSILGHLSLYRFAAAVHQPTQLASLGMSAFGRALDLFLAYLVAFAPNIAAGYGYYRRDRGVGRMRALIVGHAMIPYNYVAYIAYGDGAASARCARAIAEFLDVQVTEALSA